jgi:hypothetical protein
VQTAPPAVKNLGGCNGCAGQQSLKAAMRWRINAMPVRQLQPWGSRSDHVRFVKISRVSRQNAAAPEGRDRCIGIKSALTSRCLLRTRCRQELTFELL